MAVKPEYVTDSWPVHELETDAVDEAETLAILGRQTAGAAAMQVFRYPLYAEQRKHVLVECAHRLQSNATLEKRDRLDQYIRRRTERAVPRKEISECPDEIGVSVLRSDHTDRRCPQKAHDRL